MAGGKRKRSGRKKIADKKVQVPLFLRQSIIIANGGKEAARELCYRTLGQLC